MTLRDVIKALDDLSDEELNELRREIDLRKEQEELRPGTMDVDALLRAATDLTDGFTQDEIGAMVAAMNDEFIEPINDDVWRD